MRAFSKLANPPAVEAILDVKVVFPKGVELAALDGLHEVFRGAYPKKEEQRVVEFELHQQGERMPKPQTRDHGVTGYRFRSAGGVELVQCRKDGFTFNRLKPYPGWEEVFGKAVRAWETYRKNFPQAQISRVALRYINRIEVPVPPEGLNLREYFSVSQLAPPVEGITVSNFVTQSVLQDASSGLQANWTFARQAHVAAEKLAVVLDVDVYALGARASEADVPALWLEMRDLKNRLFFGSLTEKALLLFQ